MKQFCHVLFIALLGFYSCKKDSSPSPSPKPDDEQKLHSVQFKVNTFDVSYSDMPQGRIGDLSNHINYIHYFVYDYLGNLVSRIEQDSSMINFGSIDDSLKTGEYTIVVGAGNVYNKLWLSPDTINYPRIKLSSLTLMDVFKSSYYDDYAQGFDLFLYKSKIKVANRDTVFTNITPARIVGKLEIRLLDTFTNNTRIIYQIKNTPDPSTYLIANGVYTRIYSDIIFPDRQDEQHILGSNNSLSIIIKVQDNFYPYNTLMSKTITDVHVYPNKKTVLTGKVNDTQNTNINISVDTSYAAVVYQNF